VWGAVLAGTLTTMAVFIPVVFIEGETGQLFGDIAVAVSAAVGLSLIVSILLIPPLAARMLGSAKLETRMAGQAHWFVGEWLGQVVAVINRRTWARLLVVVGMTAASAVGSYWLMPATDYLPAGNKNLVFAFMLTPPGYSIEEFKRMGVVVEEGDPNDATDGIRPFWEAELGTPEAARLAEVEMPVGTDGLRTVRVRPAPMENFFFVSFGGGCFMGCTSKEDTNVSPLTKVLERSSSRLPGVHAFATQFSLFGRGLSGGNSIELEVRGSDYERVLAAAGAVLPRIMAAGFDYPQSAPANFNQGRDEVRLILDPEKAADLGLDVEDVGFIVEACANGAFVGEFNDRGERIDMVILMEDMQGATKEQVVRVPIFAPSGNVVPLASAVTLVQTTAPQQINHIEDMGAVTFTIQPPKGMPLQSAMEKIQAEVIRPLRESGALDASVITALAGNADKLTTTRRALIGDFRGTVRSPAWVGGSVGLTLLAALAAGGVVVAACGIAWGGRSALHAGWMTGAVLVGGVLILNPDLALALIRSRAVLACAITYLLMAALFESFLYPFVIFFSVPLAGIGAFLALRLVHEYSLGDPTMPVQQFDVLTILGFVILLGTVVNNAILVVHQALNYMREGGMDADQAIAESVRTRTRPIAMTALTTVVGMLPLVVMTGAGSELYRGIAAVVAGGMTFSTVFTLLVVPAMFSLAMEWRAAIFTAEPAGSAGLTARQSMGTGGVPAGQPVMQHSPDQG
ncbi:MAG: efflux RND transporter permease subunit, partial [Phycisphaerales bacterium]|nr:efflux RND transporter permease subunit [Phycisphaerales bacterium]